jgi:hypothetical protein
MKTSLEKRLDRILERITDDTFLQATGLGNEIAFHIFDYPPEEELRIRQHIQWLTEQIPKKRPGTRTIHINLFDFLILHLRERKLLDQAFDMQKKKGDDALRKALRGPLSEDKIAKEFAQAVEPEAHDLILVSGVGSVYPLIRSHTLLNNLHSMIDETPLVLFYPGHYDGVSLRLFGKSTLSTGNNPSGVHRQDPYYRAFRLLPEESRYEN